MFNTGLRTSEALGLLNSDIDLDRKVLHLQRGVKEVSRRERRLYAPRQLPQAVLPHP